MTSLFQKLHHICIVVHDLEQKVAYYESLGIGPWFDYPKHQPYVELDVPDVAASASMRYKCVDLDNVQLQLCAPGTLDSPQSRFLRDHGEGVYHLGFEVDQLKCAEKIGADLGLHVIARGFRADGTGFCYYDTREKAGTVLEIRK
ncbi:VOC family protein [Bartonella sp. LJL80]